MPAKPPPCQAELSAGIDSDSITQRLTNLNGIMASVATRMANEVACSVTAYDFSRPVGERTLFPKVGVEHDPLGPTGAEIPGAIADIKANIQYLHERIVSVGPVRRSWGRSRTRLRSPSATTPCASGRPRGRSRVAVGPVESVMIFWPIVLVAFPWATHFGPTYVALRVPLAALLPAGALSFKIRLKGVSSQPPGQRGSPVTVLMTEPSGCQPGWSG